MISTKVIVSRKWLEPVPVINGKKMPASDWPKYRRYCWVVRWYETNGKRRGKLFDKKRQAEKFAFEMQELANIGKQDDPEKISLKRFTAEHKKVMVKQVSDKTIVSQLRVLRLLSDFLGENKILPKITPRDAESFIAHRLKQNLSLATINHDIRTLKRVFNLAIEPRGYLREGTNPFGKIKQRKLTPKTIKYLGVTEYKALINACPRLWWKAFLSVAYCCGLRKNEILNLTWSDIDFINQMLHVRAKEEGEQILKWESKNHENRTVPMPDETAQYLNNFQAESLKGFPYIFITPERVEHICHLNKKGQWSGVKDVKNNILRDFGVIRTKAGVTKCNIHDLRRSAITNWSQALPIQVVQQFAGHSNITTTRKYYLAVRPEDIKRASDFMNSLLEEKVNQD
ncbi:MAG: tyrosine-type recombinase/integrase [Sedimentisphaerales bacterium]|nr:tyrosine-type recombinase/integrase [Sedimentisphaerales bacterium]